MILLQPLANSAGVLAVVAPGGLGVREGVSLYFLREMDIALPTAAALAILARIWFLIAEILLYLTSLSIRRNSVV